MIKWLGNAKPYEVGTDGQKVVFDGRKIEPKAAIYLATEILIAARSAMFRNQAQSLLAEGSDTSDSFPSSDSCSLEPVDNQSES